MMNIQAIRETEHKQERNMTAAQRIRKTAMETLGLGTFSYMKLSRKDKARVDRVCSEIAQDILGENPA